MIAFLFQRSWFFPHCWYCYRSTTLWHRTLRDKWCPMLFIRIPDWLRTCCLFSNCHAVKYYIVCIYIFTVFKNCCPRKLILQTCYPHSFSSLRFMKPPSPFFHSVQHWLSLNKNNFIWCLISMTNKKILLFVFNWYGTRGSTCHETCLPWN